MTRLFTRKLLEPQGEWRYGESFLFHRRVLPLWDKKKAPQQEASLSGSLPGAFF